MPKAAKPKDGKRSYDQQDYWEARYVHHLQVGDAASKPSLTKKQKTLPKKPSAAASQKRSVSTEILAQAVDSDIVEEWYYSYEMLSPLFEHHLRGVQGLMATGRVLDIGCGVSSVFADMREAGWKGEMVGIDYTPTVVEYLQRQHPAGNAQGFVFDQMDARAMSFGDNSFDFILDKATTDGLLCSDASAPSTVDMYAEIGRVLRPGGAYVCITVNGPNHGWLSDYVVPQLLDARYSDHEGTTKNAKSRKGTKTAAAGSHCRWRLEVHSFLAEDEGEDGDADDEDDGVATDGPNVYVFTKLDIGRLRSSTLDQSRHRGIEVVRKFH